MSIAELEYELQVHRDIYEIARDKLIESENNLAEAIEEEDRLRRNAEYARRSLFLAFIGFGVAVAIAKVWG
jgi:hypothetical protein